MEFWSTSKNDLGVVLARFYNPPMNYFCAGAAAELAELIEQWKSPDVKAIVLTGEAGKFITHYSVDELAALCADFDELERIGTALSDGYHGLLRSLQGLPKPVIAAIKGDCMGGGLELALWCDLRVVESGDYRLGLPEIHMGIMPGGSGTQMVSRLLGGAAAIRLIMLGELLTPEQALTIGLVHYVVDDCVDEAMKLAERLCSNNPDALALIKTSVYMGTNLSLTEGLGLEASAFIEVMKSKEALQGLTRYLSISPEGRRQWLEHEGHGDMIEAGSSY